MDHQMDRRRLVLLAFFSACSLPCVSSQKPLYIFSERIGCKSVKSEAPCFVTWKLVPFMAKRHKANGEDVNTTMRHFESWGASKRCVEEVRSVLCSQLNPRCIEDGAFEYQPVYKRCQNIFTFCPNHLTAEWRKNNYCNSLGRGRHAIGPCVNISKPIEGACPQPKYKMPVIFLAALKQKSKNNVQIFKRLREATYIEGTKVFSPSCISRWREIACTPIYCSADNKLLLAENVQGDCESVIKDCWDEYYRRKSLNYQRTLSLSQCRTFPPPVAVAKELIPPKLKLKSAGSCQLSSILLLLVTLFSNMLF